MNKIVSTPLVITIILVVLISGIIFWQSLKMLEKNKTIIEEKQSEEIVSEDKKMAPKDEASDWKTYRNEEHGFEFEYPKDWEKIIFESQETSEVYAFSFENEKIIKFWYHKPSGMLSFIMKGEEKYTLPNGKDNYQDILKIIYPDKKIKTIYSVSPDTLQWYTGISREINFSFNGDYICFMESAWESRKIFLINIATGKNILENYSIWFFDVYEDIYWSLDSKVLAIRSHLNLMDGEGADSIFVSDYGKPEKLNEVFKMTIEETYGESYFYDLYFINNNRFSFSIFSRKDDQEKPGYYKEDKRTYEYNVKIKELKEVK